MKVGMKKLSIVVLISGNGSNLQSIIDAIEAGQINAQISAIVSNNPDAYGLQRAKIHHIAQQVVNHRDYGCRDDFDQALSKCLACLNPDIIVLAGFMQILGSALIQAYPRKILNIHPSILPNYKGLNTYQRAIDHQEKEHGVSIHIVTPRLDDGAVIVRGRYAIVAGDCVADLQRKGHRLEHKMYPQVLRWLGQRDLQIKLDSILFQDHLLESPIEFEDR